MQLTADRQQDVANSTRRKKKAINNHRKPSRRPSPFFIDIQQPEEGHPNKTTAKGNAYCLRTKVHQHSDRKPHRLRRWECARKNALVAAAFLGCLRRVFFLPQDLFLLSLVVRNGLFPRRLTQLEFARFVPAAKIALVWNWGR